MTRMKEYYENRNRYYLSRHVPVICRIDGKKFSSYTKGLNKPFDEGLIEDMQKTAIYLCENIQGAKAAYTQSDEISILITDYDKLTTEAWFNYNVQKMTSVSASLATGIFNQLRFLKCFAEEPEIIELQTSLVQQTYLPKLANFDSRAFSIPQSDINNYFVARQRDAEKNSIAMLAQSLYSHKELHLKNGSDMQEMCFQKGHNWNDLHFSKKRGSLIVKNQYVDDKVNNEAFQLENGDWQVNPTTVYFKDVVKIRSKWEVVETPIFSRSEIINSLL